MTQVLNFGSSTAAFRRMPMRRGCPPCCACATSGQAAAPPITLKNSRRRIPHPRLRIGIVAAQTRSLKDPVDVRFGSEADICSAISHVRFTPKSGHVQCISECRLWARSGHRRPKQKDRLRGGLSEIRSGVLIRRLLAPSAFCASQATPTRLSRWQRAGRRRAVEFRRQWRE